MQKVRILYYEPTSGFGGSSRCLLSWLRKLDRKEFDPIVVVHHNGPAIKQIRQLATETIEAPGKPYASEKSFFLYSYLILFFKFFFLEVPTAIFIFKLIKKYRPEILHLNAKVSSVIPGIIAAKLTGVPCICHLHDIKKPVKREKFFAKWINCFIVLTAKAYDLYKKEYPGKRIEFITNGIDLNDFKLIYVEKNKLRENLDISPGEAVIGIVGRLVEGKGFSDFLKAAKILISNGKKIKFIIIGSSDVKNNKFEIYLKELCKKLELQKYVIFTGWREDVLTIMSIFDVLVQATSTFPEGFGLTVIEAMALGKALIVTDVPGPSEIVVNGETGYIVPHSNPEKLAEAIEKLINNPELAIKMGEMGRRRVEACFNLDVSVKKIEDLYIYLSNNKNG